MRGSQEFQRAIIELLKGVFGLSESPRLWWLRFRQCVLAAGFIELKYAKAAFVLYEDDGTICGLLAVHVDDGVWAGKGENTGRHSRG